MAEMPDFKKIAYEIASSHCESEELLDEQIRTGPDSLDDIIEQLHQVWNARGAADIARIDEALQAERSTLDKEYTNVLYDLLRTLDR